MAGSCPTQEGMIAQRVIMFNSVSQDHSVERGRSSYSFKLMQCGGGKQRNIPFVAREGTDIGFSVMLGVDYQSLDHHNIPQQTTESIKNHNDHTISICNKL